MLSMHASVEATETIWTSLISLTKTTSPSTRVMVYNDKHLSAMEAMKEVMCASQSRLAHKPQLPDSHLFNNRALKS